MNYGKLKIVAVSDLHGYLPEIIEPSDLCLIVGDIVPGNIQRNIPKSKEWFNTTFADWIKSLPVDHVYMVAGNHDFALENITDSDLSTLRIACQGKLTYLLNETRAYIDVYGLQWTIFGSPFCHEFGKWAFMIGDKYLTDKFKSIPDKVDIIMSHDPPFAYGDADVILQDSSRLWEHLGNKPLANRLFNVNYQLLVSGHFHSADHNFNEYYKNACVSVLNEDYRFSYKPFYHELTHEQYLV